MHSGRRVAEAIRPHARRRTTGGTESVRGGPSVGKVEDSDDAETVLWRRRLLGLDPAPECDIPGIFGTTGIAPGGELEGQPLSTGTHLFECLIHPWMRTTVNVQ